MRPVRLLATASVLAIGLFTLKAIEFGVDAADAWAARLDDAPAESTGPNDDATDESVSPLAENSLAAPVCDAPETVAEPQGSLSLRLANGGLSPSEQRILRSLRDRRAELDQRERELDTREQMLQAAELRIDERIAELRVLRDDIDTLLGTLSEQEEVELDRLVAIFNQMEPDAAAERIARLDGDMQVQIISRMTARQAGPIMAEMEIRDAANLSAMIAARHDVPDTAAELEARLEPEG
ncbi:MotE family protein [Hyphobacterium sp.]|jgi:flagellar motility protein MotE (MotC chaperone)|uniref:MotE family protein n=1 Tax=Hyphobacterium sp. TaxID=2004662 RepID=UPI003BAA4349